MADSDTPNTQNPLSEAMQQVLDLQVDHHYKNTPQMAERGNLIRTQIPSIIDSWLDGNEWSITGRDGAGRRSKVPWVRVYDETHSPSPDEGWYVVYLFAFDGSTVFLSLNQAATEGPKMEARDTTVLANQAARARIMLPSYLQSDPRLTTTIDLADPKGQLAPAYEAGNVAAITYQSESIPTDSLLRDDLEHMLKTLRKLYDAEVSTTDPLDEPLDAPPISLPPAPADPKVDFEWLAGRTLWAREELGEIVDTLNNRRPQVVLAGPPGTSKTWVAESLALYLTEGRNDAVHLVQFHPTYAYEDFVEGLRPAAGTGGSIEFKVVEGILVQAADQARGVDHPVVLVIDEMNRANLPSVFGELFYLLEYREKEIRLLQRARFSLPGNLYIIGTMNTADRSIRSIDTALRRRFDIFECAPRTQILYHYYDDPVRADIETDLSIFPLMEGMEALNNQLAEHLDRHHAIGHTFFMQDSFDRVDLRQTWDRQLKPLIDEYFFDQPDIAKNFSLENFWPE